jgi:hypothetical protein
MNITRTDDFMVIDFRPTGEVEAMHRDKFNLSFLGAQSIHRASDIRFDEDTQQWDIHLASEGGFVPVEAARGFETYEEARKMEVRWLEMARLHDLSPLSEEGTNLLRVLREKFEE